MKDKLKRYCETLGIEYTGVTDVGPYEDLRVILERRYCKGHITGMEEQDIEKRVNPKLTMKGAKSIIVCLFPYYNGEIEDSNISKYTRGKDYHIVVKEKLNQIGEYLKENINGFEYMAFTDTGALSDRYLAARSGIGYWGINGNIINDEYGSFVFIGYLITNYEFEIDKPMNKTCIKCMKCVKYCPGNVILGDFELNPSRCKSYITQKKGELSQEEIEIMKNDKIIFGCDICQDVCPHNENVKYTPIKEFKTDIIERIKCEDIVNMSNKLFKKKYYDRAFSWRGKSIILRNMTVINEK